MERKRVFFRGSDGKTFQQGTCQMHGTTRKWINPPHQCRKYSIKNANSFCTLPTMRGEDEHLDSETEETVTNEPNDDRPKFQVDALRENEEAWEEKGWIWWGYARIWFVWTIKLVVFVECGSSYTYIYTHINTLNVLGLQWVRQWGFLDLKILQEVFQNLTSLQCYQSKLYIASAKHFYVGDHRSQSPWDLLFYFHSLQVTNAYHNGFTAWMGFRSEEMQDDPFPLEGLAGVASGCMI